MLIKKKHDLTCWISVRYFAVLSAILTVSFRGGLCLSPVDLNHDLCFVSKYFVAILSPIHTSTGFPPPKRCSPAKFSRCFQRCKWQLDLDVLITLGDGGGGSDTLPFWVKLPHVTVLPSFSHVLSDAGTRVFS
jgi:hypothetical protein